MTKIAFYCNHAFALYDVLPLVQDYQKKEFEVYIITRRIYIKTIKQHFEIKESNILFIEDYTNKFVSKFTDFYLRFCIKSSFTEMYKERLKIKYSKSKLLNTKIFNVKNENSNILYSKIIKFFFKLKVFKTFPIDFYKIYAVSKIFHPYLIIPFENRTHLIVESWDHPAKEPFLINPNISESWNESLSKELMKYQYYKNSIIGKALKFRYIEEFNENLPIISLTNEEFEDVNFIKRNDVAIYPMCTSSLYYSFNEELSFVRDLAIKMTKENVKLYIRPYPLAPYNDMKELKKIENVYVGLGNKIKDGIEVFDLNHMFHKYLIIKYSKYVINLGTTFVFDAALVKSDCKIIQVVIEEKSYGNLGKYSRGTHITKYLHTDKALVFDDFNLERIGYDYKNYLKNWLNN
jgi:hypothetical protein